MSANTIRAYRSDLRQFFEWYDVNGPALVADVDLQVLTAYLQTLHDRQLAATTIARHLISIKMFFRYLVLEGILLQTVADLLNSPKLWQHLPKVLSLDVVDRLMEAPNSDDRFPLRDRALLSLLYATGCRVSEITNLRRGDLHMDQNFARCVGKGNKERIVSLNPLAQANLSTYLENERAALVADDRHDWLFVTKRGNQLSRIMVWNLVKKYAVRVGCSSDVSPHTLRHSFATHMLAGGAEIRALQEILGHASISTTQIYTHVEHSRLKSVHSRCHPRG